MKTSQAKNTVKVSIERMGTNYGNPMYRVGVSFVDEIGKLYYEQLGFLVRKQYTMPSRSTSYHLHKSRETYEDGDHRIRWGKPNDEYETIAEFRETIISSIALSAVRAWGAPSKVTS